MLQLFEVVKHKRRYCIRNRVQSYHRADKKLKFKYKKNDFQSFTLKEPKKV